MADILHKISIAVPASDVYAALTEQQGLARWWTESVRAEARVGAICRFRFDGETGPDMEILELEDGRRVRWRCVAHSGDPQHEWLGTEVFFDLEPQGPPHTALRFSHRRWLEASDFLRYCSLKWATYLLGLKRLMEGGVGNAWPRDLRI
jgi:uncharacterized protein YndB with AHSA1/START domain